MSRLGLECMWKLRLVVVNAVAALSKALCWSEKTAWRTLHFMDCTSSTADRARLLLQRTFSLGTCRSLVLRTAGG